MPKIRKCATADLGMLQGVAVHHPMGGSATALGGGAHWKGWCHPLGWTARWPQVWLHFLTLEQPKLALFFSFSSPTSPS